MKELKLKVGAHRAPFDGDTPTMCVMEAVAWMAGEPHSDHPKCVSPVLGTFLRVWNDSLDDETRQKLRPYAVRVVGTAGDGQDEVRSYMALDWLIRTYTPAFLELAGLDEHAKKLRGLPSISSMEAAVEAGGVVRAARAAAWDAAWDAAGDAARAAARAAAWDAAAAAAWDAAWDAAGAAARDAARDAAGDAAWDAARDAAGAAARDAAWDVLRPTVQESQRSAFDLLDRMVDPAGIHDIPLSELKMCERVGRDALV